MIETADKMRLGDVVKYEVWFLPENSDEYEPRLLASDVQEFCEAKSIADRVAGKCAGDVEIVRETTVRQRASW